MANLDKHTQEDIIRDIQGDLANMQQVLQTGMGTNWYGDESDIPFKDIQDLLYRIKVIEQRLKYLGGYHY